MQSSAVIRVLSLLSASWAFNTGTAPPNPPASETEQANYSNEHKDAYGAVLPVHVALAIIRTSVHSWTAVETLALAARHLPLQSFVSRLSPGGRQMADVLRLISRTNIHMSPQTTVGLALLFIGMQGRLVCYRRLARHFKFELSLQKDHKLITDGPYAIVRHPSYTAALSMLCGAVVLDLGQGSLFSELGGFSGAAKWFGVAYIGYSIISFLPMFQRCVVEDQVLKLHFKEQWQEWAEKTPYRMIPYVF